MEVPNAAEQRTDGIDHGSTIDSLYVAYLPVLRGVAMRNYGIPRADAEDLVQDIFATYLLRRSEVRDPRAYLFGAIRHASQWYGRREHATPVRRLFENEEPRAAAALSDDDVIRSLTCRAAISRLGPACRETLHRFHVLGERAASIAESRDKTENYIFRLLSYCRNRARDIYRTMEREG